MHHRLLHHIHLTNQAFVLSFGFSQALRKKGNNTTADNSKVATFKIKCWENAKSHSFYARDNVSNFLKWCRKFGVKDAVIFESDDLVSHVNPRNVVLCLLEIARIACNKCQLLPAPGLVQFEQEIDDELGDVTEADWSPNPGNESSPVLSPLSSSSPFHEKQLDTSSGSTETAPGNLGKSPSASSLTSSSSYVNSTNDSKSATNAASELDHKVNVLK